MDWLERLPVTIALVYSNVNLVACFTGDVVGDFDDLVCLRHFCIECSMSATYFVLNEGKRWLICWKP